MVFSTCYDFSSSTSLLVPYGRMLVTLFLQLLNIDSKRQGEIGIGMERRDSDQHFTDGQRKMEKKKKKKGMAQAL